MSFAHDFCVFLSHPASVIGDLEEFFPSVFHEDGYLRRSSVQGIFQKFFQSGRRSVNDLFVVVVGGGGGVSHRCSITTSSIEELEKKARVVSFERDERERESDHAHIYLKIVIQNANTKHNKILLFL